MISMAYDLAKISISTLMQPAFDAGIAPTRLDERITRSPVGQGWIERSHFTDACASLWIDGELVHLEDLVLHDAFRDTRTPTHELTIARDVLRTRRRIAETRLASVRRRPTRLRRAWPGASLGDAGAGVVDEAVAEDVANGGGEGEDGDDVRMAPVPSILNWPPSMQS
jgi:hypothetical protein